MCGKRAHQTASAATLSVWAAAQSLIVTQHVPHVCITTTKGAAWLIALWVPTSSRAGAASALNFAPKSTILTLTASSSMEESACLNAHLVTSVLHPTGEPELQFPLKQHVSDPQGTGFFVVGLSTSHTSVRCCNKEQLV